ncbi:Glutathione-binding protein GsiB precursor [Corynebacterium ciconiae DSM 44920]|uniref:TIGR04028 family ABC transporter substrate-binding protein n=1 Tax=Corynebacterium ciconiae TaxID=227319 RepID=UPI000368D8BA|nr:TIGR04028 family ABC transporter substrate-binding protein [Corynebacterium ciconiae]WKD60581.1 Glutathione-binding protein GsiB precursor [Corynebacterium ciconiae DSM 44920]
MRLLPRPRLAHRVSALSRRTGALAIAMLMLAGCTAPLQADPEDRAAAQELTYADSAPWTSLYPPTSGFYPNGGIVGNITDRLLWQDPDTLELHPWIATELPEVNEDATEYTFHLREGVTYSDGSALDAANVVANFDLFGLGDPERTLPPSEQINNYERGEVVDEHTVRFYFSAPAPGFAQATSTLNAGLLSTATLQRDAEGFGPGNAVNVVASGPFVIDSEDLGTQIQLRRREDYDWAPPAAPHHGPARLSMITIVTAPEDSVRTGALLAGQADVIRQVEAPDERRFRELGERIHAAGTGGMNNSINIRFGHPLLADQRVREAIIKGVDREEILSTLFTDSYPLATSTLASNARGYEDQSDHYGYDPDAAERLLDEAGWRRPAESGPSAIRYKNGQRLSLTMNEAVPQPRSKEIFTMMQAQLRRIGIELNLYPGDFAAQTAAAKDLDTIQLAHHIVGRADPDVVTSLWHSDKRNVLLNGDAESGEIRDPKLERLMDAISGTADPAAREQYVRESQNYVSAKAYALPLFEEPQVFALADTVTDFTTGPTARPWFYATSLNAAKEN